MGSPQPKYGSAHRNEPTELELKSDQEQQHHHAEFGNRQDTLGRSKQREAGRTNDNACDEIGDNRRQPQPPCDRDAQDGGGEEHKPQCQEAKLSALHGGFHDRSGLE